MRRQCQDDGGSVARQQGLKRLRTDLHDDGEKDRQDRDEGHEREHQRADAEPRPKKADAPFTIPMPGTSSRERDVRPYTRGFEDESRPREADRDIAVSATGARHRFSQTPCQAVGRAGAIAPGELKPLTAQIKQGPVDSGMAPRRCARTCLMRTTGCGRR